MRPASAHRGSPTVDVDDCSVDVDVVDAVQRRHVDGQTAGVLRRLVVGAAQTACDDAAPEVRRLVGIGVGNLRDGLGVTSTSGWTGVAGDRRGARPADERRVSMGSSLGTSLERYSRTPERSVVGQGCDQAPPHDRGQERWNRGSRRNGAGVVGVVHVQLHRLVIDLQLRVQHQG